MKRICILIVCLFAAFTSLSAQEITGKWYGVADLGVMKLRIHFALEKSGDTYSGTMTSPDQGNTVVPITKVTWDTKELVLEIAPLHFTYKATWKEGVLDGSFSQMGQSFPLQLSREEVQVKRPQEPKAPLLYKEEEVSFRNEKAGVTLAGTLTIPAKGEKFPAVVMVTGSGAQDRDEKIMGHKPFWVIADYLTRQGILVFRYDERGVGASEGDYTSCGLTDFAADAAAAMAWLKTRKEVDPQRVGIIGHSEGGAVAVLLASQGIPSFVVSLAGPGVNGREVLRSQRDMLFRVSGLTDDYILPYNEAMKKVEDVVLGAATDKETLKEQVKVIVNGTPLAGQEEEIIRQMTTPAILSLLQYDPAVFFKEIQCPVFALNGDKDMQVIAQPNLKGFEQITANGNKAVTIKKYPGLNHLFQTAITGMPTEYGEIEETISPVVLEDMAKWISER
ncbi:alpha/beta fold hydrolase [Parabacteroides sp. 52]|uniref:alpha/beta fold hydrolase n=1 Tax=unclassified Parabacteroides TaxID=2649774 RepID=UPI0013D0ECFF|nr:MULTISPECIES: alpha/beta fold hydrolase [unclassified Parabacteroides]MDH6533826.1 fermentation-respiration switch protein FrsA (DUF1100 family) [Parabacteroides sp. PM5-20]NDV54576.1 alpha/beta fold hydrolase [Parabacteroides sp. 52]